MADLQTKPHAWLRKLSVRDLETLIGNIKDSGPIAIQIAILVWWWLS